MDALEYLRTLDAGSVDLILTDPPYYKVKNLPWDRQWDTADGFLDWISELVEEWGRVLAPNGSLYCFASAAMSPRVMQCISGKFDVLQEIVWAKPAFSTKAEMFDKSTCRQFFPITERIIFAEQPGADSVALGGWSAKCEELRGFVFEPLRKYLADGRECSGVRNAEVNEACGFAVGSGMPRHFFTRVQWALPTAEHYASLVGLMGRECLPREYEELRAEYEELRAEYEELRAEYEELRRPFNVSKDVPYTDVWTYPTVSSRKGKHPCEKPIAMIRDIINASSRPGGLVLDSFAGSGVVGQVAIQQGRRFIGSELDEHWVEFANARIDLASSSLFAA